MDKRVFWLSLLFGTVVDAIIAYTTVIILGADFFPAFWVIWIGIIIASNAAALLRFIKGWVFYTLYGKELSTRYFLKYYHNNHFPSPFGEFELDNYLLGIVNSEGSVDKTKISAAVLIGELSAYRQMHRLSIGFMMTISGEAAMQRYRGEPYNSHLQPTDRL